MPSSLATLFYADRLSIYLPVVSQDKRFVGARVYFQAMVRFGLIIAFFQAFGSKFELKILSSITVNLVTMPLRKISVK